MSKTRKHTEGARQEEGDEDKDGIQAATSYVKSNLKSLLKEVEESEKSLEDSKNEREKVERECQEMRAKLNEDWEDAQRRLADLHHPFRYENGKGYCLVICFDDGREGNDEDVKKIEKLCEQLDMEMKLCKNKDVNGVEDYLKTMVDTLNEDSKKYAFLSMFIMAHGGTDPKTGKEFILTNKGEEICIKEKILSHLTKASCPGLTNKAALVFIQSCRGDNLNNSTNVECDTQPTLPGPNVADMLFWSATVENGVAIRYTTGSWFVQAVCNKIMKHPEHRLSKIIHSVTSEAYKQPTNSSKKSTYPIPCVSHSTLRADFYFKERND